MDNEFITLVCGFPRSGTTLTMAMLQAGGMPLHFDADKAGSWETDDNMRLPEETGWVDGCYGKAVKILDPLRFQPPANHRYRIIWLDRNHAEQAKSNIKFLKRVAGLSVPAGQDEQLIASFQRERGPSLLLLEQLSRGYLLILSFERILMTPVRAAHQISELFGGQLDRGRMASVVIRRSPRCLAGFLETSLAEANEPISE